MLPDQDKETDVLNCVSDDHELASSIDWRNHVLKDICSQRNLGMIVSVSLRSVINAQANQRESSVKIRLAIYRHKTNKNTG